MRDRRRAWCPRCSGALWAPLTAEQEAELQWSPPAGAAPPVAGPGPRPAGPPPSGYRWIAVRPGPPPPPRRRRRPLGPTPRYAVIPRWGLADRIEPFPAAPKPAERREVPARPARRMLTASAAALGAAALMQAVVYVLLIVNRTVLLHPVVAAAAVWLSRLAAVAALLAVAGCAVLLTRWLIARRAAVFGARQLPESRSGPALWAGCLVPLVNLAWAPVFTIELAGREGQLGRLRKPIVVWWLLFVLSTAVSAFAIAGSRARDAQGIADNTLAMLVAYLAALAAVAAVTRVFDGFERRSVRRPEHHWVVVAADRPESSKTGAPPAALEPDGREPAA